MCGIAGIVGGTPQTRGARADGGPHGRSAGPTAKRSGSRAPAGSHSAGWRSSTSTSARCSRCTSARCTSSSTARSTTTASCAPSSRAAGHAFTTEGDTEVLLHAWDEWGEGALDRVNAMFAFAVFDERDGSLTLAVDPFGEKPLLWARDGERLVFGSDVQALREALPALGAPDAAATAAFVAHGMMPPVARTFFAGIDRVPGGHLLRWRDGTAELRRYWAPRPVDVPDEYPEAVAVLRELLTDSIRLRLRSDVPVGTSLSGGDRLQRDRLPVGRPGRRPPPPCVHRPLPRLRARRVGLRERGRRGRRRRLPPRGRADDGDARGRPARLRGAASRSPCASSTSTPSGRCSRRPATRA